MGTLRIEIDYGRLDSMPIPDILGNTEILISVIAKTRGTGADEEGECNNPG